MASNVCIVPYIAVIEVCHSLLARSSIYWPIVQRRKVILHDCELFLKGEMIGIERSFVDIAEMIRF